MQKIYIKLNEINVEIILDLIPVVSIDTDKIFC